MTSTTAENGIDDPSHVERPAANSPRSKEEDSVALRLSADRVSEVRGKAALDLWSRLPQGVQHQLFEHAVLRGHQTEADEVCANNWRSFCTTITSARLPADGGQAGMPRRGCRRLSVGLEFRISPHAQAGCAETDVIAAGDASLPRNRNPGGTLA